MAVVNCWNILQIHQNVSFNALLLLAAQGSGSFGDFSKKISDRVFLIALIHILRLHTVNSAIDHRDGYRPIRHRD